MANKKATGRKKLTKPSPNTFGAYDFEKKFTETGNILYAALQVGQTYEDGSFMFPNWAAKAFQEYFEQWLKKGGDRAGSKNAQVDKTSFHEEAVRKAYHHLNSTPSLRQAIIHGYQEVSGKDSLPTEDEIRTLRDKLGRYLSSTPLPKGDDIPYITFDASLKKLDIQSKDILRCNTDIIEGARFLLPRKL